MPNSLFVEVRNSNNVNTLYLQVKIGYKIFGTFKHNNVM